MSLTRSSGRLAGSSSWAWPQSNMTGTFTYLAVSFYEAASLRDSRYRELALYHLAQLREVAPHSPFLRQFPNLLAELSDKRRIGTGG